ncbi:adrenocorticotropic hormone receptor-like [Argopecten irradians]|uniref:adrenocorticotropic hormone receptor-like n=1 Tax=Argopecten irradians TaxID=31199 RepID=UPI00371ADEA6
MINATVSSLYGQYKSVTYKKTKSKTGSSRNLGGSVATRAKSISKSGSKAAVFQSDEYSQDTGTDTESGYIKTCIHYEVKIQIKTKESQPNTDVIVSEMRDTKERGNNIVLFKTPEQSEHDGRKRMVNVTDILDDDLDLAIKPYLLLILFIEGLLSIVGNLIICLMTITMPILRKKTYVYFILCLSFSDLLFGSSTIDHYFQSRLDYIPTWRCILTLIVSLSTFLISMTQTLLICLERTLRITKFPNSSSWVSDKNRTSVVLVLWVICFMYVCILTTTASKYCSYEDSTVEDILSNCSFICIGVFLLFTPIYIGIVCLYIFLLYKIKKLQTSVRNLKFNPENPSEVAVHSSSLKLFRNIFKTLSVFVSMYIISFTPFLILLTESFIFGSFERKLFAVVAILIALNSLISPLLYIWRFKEVRGLFKC